jgi:L-ribulokinase
MSKYSLGLDFGTLSVRAILIELDTGREIAAAVSEYKNGIMSKTFLDGSALPMDFALQHPKDYINSMLYVIKECISSSKIDPKLITGVGVDFTASTILPVYEDGTPLCFSEKYENEPHAYAKLWKHHAAQNEADDINALAKKTGAKWLKRYGGAISSEWLFPKVLEILRKAPDVYNDTARFIEGGDFIVWQLTGNETHSICQAGFKAMWDEETGYPAREFLKELDERFENVCDTKISKDITKLSKVAGYTTKKIEELTGLPSGIAVAPAFIDAHAALPALGVTHTGEMLMIIGTSSCHILLGDTKAYAAGTSGFVRDGIVDGLYAFEAGQASVGDSFEWFIKNALPASYTEAAKSDGVNIHTYLTKKAEKLSPGANGVMALDWFNGNRTPYVNGGLSGLIIGLNLNTQPEQIYRALIEATAYGTKRIVDIYEKNGITIDKIYAAGGIAEKNAMLMQIYSDVLGREIYLSGTAQACAYGSAMLGAVAGGAFESLTAAGEAIRQISSVFYKPNSENTKKYAEIYREYVKLCEFFANSENKTMDILRKEKA